MVKLISIALIFLCGNLMIFPKNMIYAPASFRTLAQGLVEGDYCYRYDGVGGQSWAVPYVVYWHLVGR